MNLTTDGNITASGGRDKFKGAKLVWTEAFETWGMAWELHVYGFAVTFFLLAVWGLIHAIKAGRRSGLPSKAYYVTMHSCVALCCAGRTWYLLTNTYGTRSLVPKMVSLLPKFAMFPCITSCFILLFALFMRLTKMQIISDNLFSAKKIIFIVACNFILAYGADLLAEFIPNGAVFYFVCDTYFVSWGLVSSIAFFYVFSRFYSRVVVNRRKLNALANDATAQAAAEKGEYDHDLANGYVDEKIDGKSRPDHSLDTAMPLAGKITVLAGVCFFLIGAVNIYRFVNLFRDFNKDRLAPASPWSWWLYNTFMRAFELVMNAAIAFVATLPFYEAK